MWRATCIQRFRSLAPSTRVDVTSGAVDVPSRPSQNAIRDVPDEFARRPKIHSGASSLYLLSAAAQWFADGRARGSIHTESVIGRAASNPVASGIVRQSFV